jgi:hypothetical protein
MDIVMGWLSKIDVTAVVAAVVSFLLGLAFIKPKLGKAISIIGDLADLLSEMKKSLEDGKLTSEEANSIIKEANELIAEFKK